MKSANRGAALLEAMIAVLILSFGLLGMVGMQTAAVRYEQNSWARAAVSTLTADIADRIRANPAADAAYSRTVTYAIERTTIASDTSTFVPPVDCMTSTCTADQLAAYDVARWRQSVESQLPAPVGVVQGQRSSAYTVTVAWFDRSMVDSAGALESSVQCNAATANSVEPRNCCPNILEAPAGVRCINLAVVP